MTVWGLRQYADTVDVGKAGAQGVGMVGADCEFHLAGIVENLFHDFHIAVLDYFHHIVHCKIGK